MFNPRISKSNPQPEFSQHMPRNPLSQENPAELSIDEMRQIIKVIVAWNQDSPLEFNKAFLDYADNIDLKIERPTPDTLNIRFGGVR